MNAAVERAASIVRARSDLAYEVGVILGSGLGRVGDLVAEPVRIPYAALPGFPVSSVTAHKNELIAGTIGNVPVVVLSGRSHYFETGDADAMRTPIGTLRDLGCDTQLFGCLLDLAGAFFDFVQQLGGLEERGHVLGHRRKYGHVPFGEAPRHAVLDVQGTDDFILDF